MKQKHKRIITRVAVIYPVFALLLLPWTLYLSRSLPNRYISIHWDISWVGLNVALILAFIVTGYLSYLQSRWVAISASVLGSILVIDAWFDILTGRTDGDFKQAVLLALFIELPIALTSFVIAARALKYSESTTKRINPYVKVKHSKKHRKSKSRR